MRQNQSPVTLTKEWVEQELEANQRSHDVLGASTTRRYAELCRHWLATQDVANQQQALRALVHEWSRYGRTSISHEYAAKLEAVLNKVSP